MSVNTEGAGRRQIVKCHRGYPTTPEDANEPDCAIDFGCIGHSNWHVRFVPRDDTSRACRRISAVRDADEIIVLDNGEVVEHGRHEDLVTRGGRYAQLLQRQQLLESIEAA